MSVKQQRGLSIISSFRKFLTSNKKSGNNLTFLIIEQTSVKITLHSSDRGDHMLKNYLFISTQPELKYKEVKTKLLMWSLQFIDKKLIKDKQEMTVNNLDEIILD